MTWIIALFCFLVSILVDPLLKMESVAFFLFG